MADFLNQQKKRVVLNDKYPLWALIEVRNPHGSLLGPLFFNMIK